MFSASLSDCGFDVSANAIGPYVNIMVPDMAEQVTFGIFFKLYVVDGSLTFQHL